YSKECFGVMMIYAGQTDAFQDEERQLLAGLADDLSFAMDALRTSQRHAATMASLAASEVRFRKLFYDHSAIKVITDADTGKIVDANAAAERFYGWSVEQLKRMTISQVNMLDEECLKTAIGKTKKGEQKEYEFKHRLADGSVRDVAVFINPMEMEGKTLFYCIIQDITERKQAERDLLDSGRLVSDVLNSLGSLMVVLDERGNIMAVNGAWQSFAAENGGDQSKLGVGANYLEVCKMSLTENVDETASAVLHGIQAVLDGTKPAFFLEYPCHSPTSKRWFAMKVRPFSGNRKGAVIEHENITERKLAEAKARESEMRFTIMADAVPVLIWEAGTDMLCCYFNQPWLDFTGRTLAQETGNGWSEGVHPDDLAHCMEIYTRSFNARQEFQMEYRLRRRDGEYRWLLDHGTPRFQAEGAFAGYIGSCVDITEHKRAEEKQRVLSQRLELATHAGGVGIWDWDIVNNDLIWDDTICEIYGVPHGGFTGGVMEWSEHLHPDDRSRVGDDLQAAQRGEREYASEFRIIWPDGSIHHIKANSQTFFDENGKPLRMVGTNIDITERKQAVAELAASEKRHRAIIDSSTVPQAGNDEQQNITYLNQAFVSTFGYTQEDIPTLADWWPKAYPDPEYRKIITETWTARLAKAKQTGNAFEPLEVEVRCKDGNIKTILATMSSLFEGSYEGENLVVLYDITERKLIEESHARLAAAVEQAAESIVITDPDGTIIYVNPMFETSTGYTRVEAIGQTPRILKGGKQNAGFYQKMWTMLQRGEVWQGHFINKRKDGSLYEEEATISPIRTTEGKITSFVAVKRDVTREVELENQLRHSQKMKAIGTLAGGVAHDFNNILAAIQMQAEILDSSGGLSDDQADLTREMLVSVKRAADLTRQLLLFSRKQVMQPDHLDLNESVTSMTKILTRVLGENIEVRLKLAEQPLPADADAGMLDQVLMNLAINARDAMSGNGQLVIETVGVEFDESTAAQTSQARPGKFVRLSVSDTGYGISPENLPRIFEPFFTTKDVGKGTGLGLATAFGIVQQHKGWINVYSEVGQGTTFRVYLPQLAETHDAKIIKELSPPARTGSETILLVEDESTLLGLMRMVLTQLGYRVLEAPTGVKAMEVWQEHSTNIHLLLTDLFMPDGLNGKELAHRLLAEKPNLKVVYMSGYSADIIDKDFALKEGENFLAKPFDPKNLAQIIRANLDKPTPLKPIKRPQRRKS
ncbi:MAG: PAS domain S-box protein, partial [Verrucomicrobiota bacterium]